MFPLLATITFVIWLAYELRKYDRLNKKAYNDFWKKEREANQVRKKPLDNLSFVSVPMDFIPQSLLSEDDTVADCIRILNQLNEQKIVNLTGYSNTDLKLEYGSANLALLTEYDENYTLFVRTINKLAHAYHKAGYESNARILLEYSIKTGADIKATYVLLAQIYSAHDEKDKLAELVAKADSLQSASKNAIKHALAEFVQTD